MDISFHLGWNVLPILWTVFWAIVAANDWFKFRDKADAVLDGWLIYAGWTTYFTVRYFFG